MLVTFVKISSSAKHFYQFLLSQAKKHFLNNTVNRKYSYTQKYLFVKKMTATVGFIKNIKVLIILNNKIPKKYTK